MSGSGGAFPKARCVPDRADQARHERAAQSEYGARKKGFCFAQRSTRATIDFAHVKGRPRLLG
jgi:hypothetical protein